MRLAHAAIATSIFESRVREKQRGRKKMCRYATDVAKDTLLLSFTNGCDRVLGEGGHAR